MSVNPVPTWYADNLQDSNLVIDLIFLYAELEEFNNHYIQERKQTIVKNSKKEKKFVKRA